MLALKEIVKQQRIANPNKDEHEIELVCVLDKNGVARYVSEEHICVLSYEPHELTGTRLLNLVHPDDLNLVLERFFHMVGNATKSTANYRIRHRDGRWIPVQSEGMPLVQDDKSIGFMTTTRVRTVDLQRVVTYMEVERLCKNLNNQTNCAE